MKDFHEEDWWSAWTTFSRVREPRLSRTANETIATRAHAGLIRTWAELLIIGTERFERASIPAVFWWSDGNKNALVQNWQTGDFETWIDRQIHFRAFGVRFLKADVEKLLPAQFGPAITPSEATEPPNRGGRGMSPHWPEWVAELVVHLDQEGISAGVGHSGAEAIIASVEARLAERGLEAPSRATVQPAVNATLRAMRNARNLKP